MPVLSHLVRKDGGTELQNYDDAVVLRLELPEEKLGVWVLIGRVVLDNADGDKQGASARLTTRDGAVVLDRVDTYIPFNTPTPVPLQAFIRTEDLEGERIVDLRASTYNGGATDGRLFALLVEDVTPE